MSVLRQPELQQQTLRFFGELVARQPDWAGKLVLGVSASSLTAGLPAACSLAGAASLLLEPNPADAKAALRDGGIDFLVATVDEALRTLKNEIRKKRPLAVALVCEVDSAVAELLDRGVRPDLLFGALPEPQSGFAKGPWGGIPLLQSQTGSATHESEVLTSYLESRRLEFWTWSLSGRAAIQALDAHLLGVLDEEDAVRRRWLKGIVRYQRSADRDHRTAWVTAEERDRISRALDATH